VATWLTQSTLAPVPPAAILPIDNAIYGITATGEPSSTAEERMVW
jgi:hypothetical protein